MFVKVINFLCEIRGHSGRTGSDGCQLSLYFHLLTLGLYESAAQGLYMGNRVTHAYPGL